MSFLKTIPVTKKKGPLSTNNAVKPSKDAKGLIFFFFSEETLAGPRYLNNYNSQFESTGGTPPSTPNPRPLFPGIVKSLS